MPRFEVEQSPFRGQGSESYNSVNRKQPNTRTFCITADKRIAESLRKDLPVLKARKQTYLVTEKRLYDLVASLLYTLPGLLTVCSCRIGTTMETHARQNVNAGHSITHKQWKTKRQH